MKTPRGGIVFATSVTALVMGCGAGSDSSDTEPTAPYASAVVSFEPGDSAGFGEDRLPDIVLGPPRGGGQEVGSLDVLSLGKGGSIEVGFGTRAIVDGDGPDFVVFENAFWPGGSASQVFAEPGAVEVSDDGDSWTGFACVSAGDGEGHFPGCAGWTPTLVYDASALVPLDPAITGGDAFDLAEIGVARARFVRITDVSYAGAEPTAGFDLDAVGVIHVGSDEAP